MAYKEGSLMILLLLPNASFIKYVSQQSLGYVSDYHSSIDLSAQKYIKCFDAEL